jgi:hypothetical protein
VSTPDGAHEPPTAGAEMVTERAVAPAHWASDLSWPQVLERISCAQLVPLVQAVFGKTFATGMPQVTPVGAPQVQAEHEAAGAMGVTPPDTAFMVFAGHEGAADEPWKTTTGPCQAEPAGAGATQVSPAGQAVAPLDDELLVLPDELLVLPDELLVAPEELVVLPDELPVAPEELPLDELPLPAPPAPPAPAENGAPPHPAATTTTAESANQDEESIRMATSLLR